MKKFIPYEKLSKKEKRRLDAQKRGTWGMVKPATRVHEEDRKKYSRKQKHPKQETE